MALNPFTGNAAALSEIPVELQPQFQQANTQQRMADLLMQQGMQGQPQGQMVSGHYVKPSWSQQLAPVANQALALFAGYQADKGQTDLASALRQRKAQDVQNYMEAMSPVAAKEGGIAGPNGMTTQTTADMYGPNMELNPAYKQVAPVEGRGPDFAKAFQVAYNSYDPALRAQALDMIKSETLPEGATKGRMNLQTGQWEAYAHGNQKMSGEVRTAAQLLGITKPMEQWTPQDYALVNQKANERERAKGTVVNIPNFMEKTFGGEVATDQAKKFNAMQGVAQNSPIVLGQIQNARDILKSGKFFSGPTANIQQDMALYADALGLGGKDTTTKAANTQSLITGAADSTLNSIATSGLGSGQGFTDKDLRFLQDAKSFRITMNKENINRVLNLQEKAVLHTTKMYNERLKSIPKSTVQSMGLQPVSMPNSDLYNAADEIIGK